MNDHNPIEEQIVDYLQEGKKSTLDNPVLNKWQQASPDNKNDLDKFQKIWDATPETAVYRKFDSGKAWDKVDYKLQQQTTRIRQIKNFALIASGMAASLLIVLGLTFYTNLFSASEATIAMSTTNGSRSEIVLPDGTLVKLNAGSKIEYHFDKVRNTRRVNFSGEGFFEVAKSKKPFVITTAEGLNVKVLGTKFNLSAYSEDKIAQTTLVEGKVELSTGGKSTLILQPGQIANFDKTSNEINYTSGDVSHLISWMQDKLYMDNMSLGEVCTKLERWYDVKIILADESLGKKIHYTGVLKEESVTDVLDALSQLSSISYKLKGKEIQISEK